MIKQQTCLDKDFVKIDVETGTSFGEFGFNNVLEP